MGNLCSSVKILRQFVVIPVYRYSLIQQPDSMPDSYSNLHYHFQHRYREPVDVRPFGIVAFVDENHKFKWLAAFMATSDLYDPRDPCNRRPRDRIPKIVIRLS
jgi:c-di-AMP phosphodiesterase-like protein